MQGHEFKGLTFYYLRALNVCDLLYLFSFVGVILEYFLKQPETEVGTFTRFYLVYFDSIILNPCVTNSGFIIVLLTVDRSLVQMTVDFH